MSLPSAKATTPAATATAEPELEPPAIQARSNTQPQRAIGTSGAGEAGGELIEVGLADRDRAGGDQPGDDFGVALGACSEGRAGGGGGEAGEIEVILHREGNAGQGQVLAGRQPGVDRPAPAPARPRRRSG